MLSGYTGEEVKKMQQERNSHEAVKLFILSYIFGWFQPSGSG
jgi:hypothetical protein